MEVVYQELGHSSSAATAAKESGRAAEDEGEAERLANKKQRQFDFGTIISKQVLGPKIRNNETYQILQKCEKKKKIQKIIMRKLTIAL